MKLKLRSTKSRRQKFAAVKSIQRAALACIVAFSTLNLSADSGPALPALELQSAFPELTLDRPVRMEESPDGSGRFFILEQAGRIVIVPKGSDGKVTQEFLNIVDRKPYVENEEGLLGLAFHPQFRANGLFYIYYNQQSPRRSVISEFKASATNSNKADLTSERILMEIPQPYGNHKGGQVSFGPDRFRNGHKQKI